MAKKTFTPDTTAAAELFSQPAQDNQEAATTATLTPEMLKAITAAIMDGLKTAENKKRPAACRNRGPRYNRALFDGERRDHRLQITCKESIARKFATIARRNGISMNYLFELFVIDAERNATRYTEMKNWQDGKYIYTDDSTDENAPMS